ncbi:hypothetical protein MC885_017257, partial [Smutsia gigantea]
MVSVVPTPSPFPCRHRACNMFLESYKAVWILTEDHSFEDRMIDDLSVSWGLPGSVGAGLNRAGAEAAGRSSPGVALRIDGCGNGGPCLQQNPGRGQDKAGEQEEEEEEVEDKKPDPLHQLVLHFSRTALTEK